MTDQAMLYRELSAAFDRHDWRAILPLASQLIPLLPHHAGVFDMTGVANLELQQPVPAAHCFRRAWQLEPTNAGYAVQLAKALTLGNHNADAAHIADQALAMNPGDPWMLDALGIIYSQMGAYDRAVKAFEKLTELAPQHAPSHYNLSTALIALGHLEKSEVALDQCLRLDPHYWRAHLSLSQLRRQSPANNHVERLRRLIANMGDQSADSLPLVCLNMALSKEYEDLGEYAPAYDHLVAGKRAAGGPHRSYSIQSDETLFRTLAESFPVPIVADETGYPSDQPIFVIGMPRTGTTLVERILTSHPKVQSAGELLNFAMSLKQLSGVQTRRLIDTEIITAAREIDPRQLGERYISSTTPITGAHKHFLDKLPHNFLYAGFIARALPKARIICLRRDPMDTCLSNFRQLFATESPFFDYSFDLLDIGRYYLLFDRLMAHWQRVLPGRILEIQYETIVKTQETSSRRIIDFCGLPWDDACMNFESNPSPVGTASAVQVRAPMYHNALQRWKKYGSKMDALHELLYP